MINIKTFEQKLQPLTVYNRSDKFKKIHLHHNKMKNSATKPIINDNNDNNYEQEEKRITLNNVAFRTGIIKMKKSS